jgi:hypothetical protein
MKTKQPEGIVEWESQYDKTFSHYEFTTERALRTNKEFIIKALQSQADKSREEDKITEDTSDGYHTFKELYEFRKVYNAVLFNEWAKQGKYEVHKSKKHFDGKECFGGGWFIVMATLPTGQISNHYENKDWDMFECEGRDKADKWDGHEAKDVVKRLLKLTN